MLNHILTHLGKPSRPQQARAFAHIITEFEAGRPAIVDAPTGTGKSLVAIAAALTAHQRTGAAAWIVAPMNNLLQQYAADCRALGLNFQTLMGRKHYLCACSQSRPTHVQDWLDELDALLEDEDWGAVADHRETCPSWADDWLREHANAGPADSKHERGERWQLACPGSQVCRGRDIGGCGYLATKARAQTANLLVLNVDMAMWARAIGHTTDVCEFYVADARVRWS